MAEKAAVVIGVYKTGGLAKLNSAAAGASAVSVWLRNEGYDVECLTDQTAQVHARDIEDAVAKFVTVPPRYRLLVVYFSGHGYWHARTDLWLLSGAPTKTSDAINLDGAMDLARYSGIPNIVFISDACRSVPDSRVGARVTGIDAFPNYRARRTRCRGGDHEKEAIDRLRALVALAVKNNTFQVGSDREAELLGQRIRIGKSIDPTLDLYAAHAYSQASK